MDATHRFRMSMEDVLRMSFLPRSHPSRRSKFVRLRTVLRTHFLQNMSRDLDERPELMRGVPWAAVLDQVGAELRSGPKCDPAVAAQSYAKSSQVPRLSCFLTHSWHAPGTAKAMALLYHRNGVAADAVGVCTALACFALGCFGVLPAWATQMDASYLDWWLPGAPSTMDVRAWCVFCFMLGRGVTIISWHRLICAPRQERLFLDKLCIHQTDADLKQEGIRLIGHYLMRTDELLVLLDGSYLRRLWCVFELATFLALNEEGELNVCLISLGCGAALIPQLWTVNATGLCGLYSLGAIEFLYRNLQGNTMALFALFVSILYPMLGVVVYLARIFAQIRTQLEDQLKSFRLADADCFEEKDRNFVEHRVCELYGTAARFDDFAREKVQANIRSLLGPACEVTLLTSFRAFSLPFLVICLDVFLMLDRAHLSYRCHFCFGLVVFCTFYTLTVVKMVDRMARCCPTFAGRFRDIAAAAMLTLVPSLLACSGMLCLRFVLNMDIHIQILSCSALMSVFGIAWRRSLLEYFHAEATPEVEETDTGEVEWEEVEEIRLGSSAEPSVRCASSAETGGISGRFASSRISAQRAQLSSSVDVDVPGESSAAQRHGSQDSKHVDFCDSDRMPMVAEVQGLDSVAERDFSREFREEEEGSRAQVSPSRTPPSARMQLTSPSAEPSASDGYDWLGEQGLELDTLIMAERDFSREFREEAEGCRARVSPSRTPPSAGMQLTLHAAGPSATGKYDWFGERESSMEVHDWFGDREKAI